MTFSEFVKYQFPERSVFDRVVNNKKLDLFTNLVKWFAIRFAYILSRLGITENMLDIITFPVSLLGYFFLARAAYGERGLPLLGVALIFFRAPLKTS